MMLWRFFLVFFIALWTEDSRSQTLSIEDVCGQRPITTNVERVGSLQTTVDATARTLFGARGKADLDIVYRERINDIFSKYPDADRTVIARSVIYTYCALIYSAKDLSSLQKLEEFRKMDIISKIQAGFFDRSRIEFVDKQISHQIEVNLAACNALPSFLQCSFVFKAMQDDAYVEINKRKVNASDDVGNFFEMQNARIANGGYRHLLVKGVETPVVIDFSTAGIFPSLLSRLHLEIEKEGSDPIVVFRNIPVGELSN